MSIRIHQLSKKIGVENKELLALLQERGFNVTSASSTVDNISADALVDEFAAKARAEASAAEAAAAESLPAEETKEPAKPAGPRLPPGVFVKSAEQVAQEKEAALEASRPKPAPAVTPRPLAAPPPSIPPPVRHPHPVTPASGLNTPVTPPPPRVVHPPVHAPSPGVPPLVVPQPQNPAPVSVGPADTAAADSRGSGEIRTIQVKPPIVVRDFALALGLKPFKLISELMEMGIFASMNQSIEEPVAVELAEKHGVILDVRHRGDAVAAAAAEKKKPAKKVEDESLLLEPRPPVACILGHVDHGKTSLLDRIRQANVVAGEFGGITQHIGAYQAEIQGKKITFIDTPGHAAFNEMRARGANVTDVAILVVAADDGFMPQTDEALKHIRNAGVTPIVAINKIDTKGANIDRVKTQLQERNLMPEDWGGETITVPVSAIRGDGVDTLLEMILLQAELLELKANPKKPASGVVIEAQMEVGRGPTATVIVQAGTLKPGDALVCGHHYTKVKAMFNEHGKAVREAGPSTPVRVIGWSGTPECGQIFETVKNEREAKKLAEEREYEYRKQQAVSEPDDVPQSVENLFLAMAAARKKILRIVLKADVFGSVEAVESVLRGIKSDKVSLEIIQGEVGLISKNDVLIAGASEAIIVGFNAGLENGVKALAKHHGVEIHSFQIIYELVDRVRDMMADLLEPETKETKIGAAEVRQVFQISNGRVAGCLVVEGRVVVNALSRVRRKGKVEVETRIETIRRVKDEVKEVRAGTECGIHLKDYSDYEAGDVIECFEVETFRASL
ncbi:MAG: translation initiation factor IF-2 [Opitutaceae bacterium]